MHILFYCTRQLSFSFPIALFVHNLGGLCGIVFKSSDNLLGWKFYADVIGDSMSLCDILHNHLENEENFQICEGSFRKQRVASSAIGNLVI